MADHVDNPGIYYFNNPTFSDIKLRLHFQGNTTEYHAHRIILSTQSTWFTKALMGGFKEATEEVVDIHDDDPVFFEMMLKFFYTGTLDVKLMTAGDYTERKHQQLSLIKLSALADKYACQKLLEACASDFMLLPGVDFSFELVQEHYKTCVQPDTEIGRDIARRACRTDRSPGTPQEFKDLLKQFPVFATDLVLGSMDDGTFPAADLKRCDSCDEVTYIPPIAERDPERYYHCIGCCMILTNNAEYDFDS